MAVNDLAIAATIFGFMVGLAIAAPIWGFDSRDGFDSDQPARRVAWLYDRGQRQPGRSTSGLVAGALRTVAYRLDAQAARPIQPDGCLAEAC
jgi:hypothetical protein